MSPRKHFDFTGGADYKYLMGFQVNVGETVTLDCLQGLFEDLYLQRRLAPDHLFVAKSDHKALSDEVLRASTDDIDLPEEPALVKILNYASGRYVHVVSLPDLEQGSVILGFFQ